MRNGLQMWRVAKPYFYIAPAFLIIMMFLIAGVGEALLQSLGRLPFLHNQNLSFATYERMFSGRWFLPSLLLTLRVSVISTIISGVIGLAIAYFFMNRPIVYLLPFAIPHIVAAYMIFLLFTSGGLISGLLYQMGVIDSMHQFPVLVHDSFGVGIILAFVWKEAPFIAVFVAAAWKQIDQDWSLSAANLGANRWQTFRYVTFPMLLPAWWSAMLIAFAFTLTSFEIPYILGITFPKFLSVYAYDYFTHPNLAHRSMAMAINLLLSAIAIVIAFLYFRMQRRWDT
ncbi:hypothetical protein BHU72_07235 [Desulfuribacillus stibiiarsenatis]|uniref:ABC transmembrane type-1 domain-containing protein n=1 Tax=Desulfuribacillus stibiiarsenatis TaxID=1390249 RepID=A0A1E5L4F1_9FIRM|nr:ABC transporter permease subunit [Desulfuribacillus stibiiarsenatis]OEH84976.1 hypothetical protein BHU72_07235 [Desulfuribacillus stibiiarsenatis]